MKGYKLMDELSHDYTAATKVIAKACSWCDLRKAAQGAPLDPRKAGQYKAVRRELAEAVEKYRKIGGQP
jgi:hypothetical protein